LATAQALGLVVRDAPQAALLTMRVYYLAAKPDLILRSPPKAGVSKDGHEGTATKCDSPAACGERHRPPSAAVHEIDAEAKLRLCCIEDAIRVRGTGLNFRRARRREALHPNAHMISEY